MSTIIDRIVALNGRFEDVELRRLGRHCKRVFNMIAKQLHKKHRIKNHKVSVCSAMGSTSIWIYSPRLKRHVLISDFFKLHHLTGHGPAKIEETLQSIEDEFYWDWTKCAPYKFWLNADGVEIIEE